MSIFNPFFDRPWMRRDRLVSLFLAVCLTAIASWGFAAPAWAITQIKLYDLSYRDCPTALSEGAVASGSIMSANCFIVSGKAKNPSGKTIYDADIYGRVYDANNNNVLPNRTRLGKIDEVPPGESNFELQLTVPSNLPTPLKLEQFKASGFTGRVRF
ncbi:hypothetical protein [Oxynema sp. CENA135]|uniref:hypothetical protein n=1 Tax=Oxynema sp. CENA135 TaxID=984206 RepID=UPI00351CAAAC